MENKKTTELLDKIHTLTKDGQWNDDCTEILDELKSREPFYTLFNPRGKGTVEEEIESLEEDIKLLKRHKHDNRTGDVVVRI